MWYDIDNCPCERKTGDFTCIPYCNGGYVEIALMDLQRETEKRDNEHRKQRLFHEAKLKGPFKVIEYEEGGACPTQGDGRLENGRPIYTHYRHGRLSVSVGPVGGYPFGDYNHEKESYKQTWTHVVDHKMVGDEEGDNGNFLDLVRETEGLFDWSAIDALDNPPFWYRMIKHSLDKFYLEGEEGK